MRETTLQATSPVLIKVIKSDTSKDLARDFGDMALDFIEEKVMGSASKVADALILPLCAMIRKGFDLAA